MKSTILLLFQTIVLSTWLTPVIFLTPRCDLKKKSQYKWSTEFFFDPESDTKILARFKYLIHRFESDPQDFFWVHKIHGQNLIILCLFESDMALFYKSWARGNKVCSTAKVIDVRYLIRDQLKNGGSYKPLKICRNSP